MKKNKDNKPTIGAKERRTYPGEVQIRMEIAEGEEQQESRTVEGYAAVFNSDTDMGWWIERIAPGAFSEAINDDVRALFNHDANLILARSNNTLELWEDEKGLGYRFEAPNTTAGNDLLENLRNGNITQSSFGFTIDKYEIDETGDREILTITKVGRLFDVSPVTFPAYETTEATARSIEAMQAEQPGPDDTGEDSDEGPDDAIVAPPTTIDDDIEYYKMKLIDKE